MQHVQERRLVGALGLLLLLVAIVGVRAEASRNVTSTISVTVGHPAETSVSLSKNSLIPPGSVVFKVKNVGKAAHTFKVCLNPNGGTANTCVGKSISLATTGLTRTLTLTLKKGKYEYLSMVRGQTIAGRKGLIGVGVVVPKLTTVIPISASPTTTAPKPTTTPKTTTSPTTTGATTTPAPGFPVGNAGAGAPLFASSGCGSCHTLAAAGTTGTVGPNLDQAKPALALIEFRVKNGGLDMPPFGGQLTDQQIADLATYVYQSTH